MSEIKNYLAQGAETEEGIDILISLTEMSSVLMRTALIRHYVQGAAAEYCTIMVSASNFARDCKKLNDVARKIDRYHELFYRKNQIGDNNRVLAFGADEHFDNDADIKKGVLPFELAIE